MKDELRRSMPFNPRATKERLFEAVIHYIILERPRRSIHIDESCAISGLFSCCLCFLPIVGTLAASSSAFYPARCKVVPLRPSFCALGFDPILRAMAASVHQSLICACVDDVATALVASASLLPLAGVYRDAELAAGLIVKASKSAVVLIHPPTRHRIEVVKDWLRRFVAASGRLLCS